MEPDLAHIDLFEIRRQSHMQKTWTGATPPFRMNNRYGSGGKSGSHAQTAPPITIPGRKFEIGGRGLFCNRGAEWPLPGDGRRILADTSARAVGIASAPDTRPRSLDGMGSEGAESRHVTARTEGVVAMEALRIVRDLRKSYWAAMLRIAQSTSSGAQ